MEKEVEGCANLLLASSALTNFNFSHFSLSGFWKFLLLFFYFFPPCSCCFFLQNPLPAAPLPKRSRLQPGARLSLNTWQRRSPQIFMRMLSRFAVFWRFSPGSESRCRLFFFFPLHMLPTGKEQKRSQKRVLCPDTDVRIRIHARFFRSKTCDLS